MSLTLGHMLTVGAILFALSVTGIFLNRKNLIVLLMAIELMLLAVNLNFVAFSYFLVICKARCLSFLSSRWPPQNLPLVWPFWSCCSATKPASMWKNSTASRADITGHRTS